MKKYDESTQIDGKMKNNSSSTGKKRIQNDKLLQGMQTLVLLQSQSHFTYQFFKGEDVKITTLIYSMQIYDLHRPQEFDMKEKGIKFY